MCKSGCSLTRWRTCAGADPEATIKNVLLRLLRMDKPETTAGFVRFDQVKGSQADVLALTPPMQR
jgi:hypothetical protein